MANEPTKPLADTPKEPASWRAFWRALESHANPHPYPRAPVRALVPLRFMRPVSGSKTWNQEVT